MANNITVKDASGNNKVLHTIEDSTSAHYNQSIPINTSGALLFDVLPGNVSVTNTLPIPVSITGGSLTATIADNAPVSVRGGVLGAVSIGGGTAQIGRVSVFVDQVPFNVSINNSLPVPVSIVGGRVSIADSALAVTQSGTWNTNASVVGRVSVFVDQVPFNVSINNSLPVPVSVVGGRVSIQGISQVSVAGLVTVDAKSNTGAAVPAGAFFVGGTDGTNLRGFLTDTVGALVITSIKDDVSIAPQTLLVHVCNALPAAGATVLTSIGGAVSTQAVQIAGVDGSGNARTPKTHTDGSLLVHVCNAQPAPTGITQMVSIGGAVSLQAVQVAGRDTNGDARSPLMTTTGIQFVNVCNAIAIALEDNAPVSVRGGRVSIADSTLAVTQSGTWNTNASVVGRVSVFVDQVPFNVSINNTLPVPVSIVGGTISMADNAPVSVRGGRVSIADSTLAVTQSGTWNTNASVVGRVSVFVDQVPFNVSINNSLPVPVSVVGGRVSIADSTLAVTQSGTWNTNASVVGRVSVFVDQVPFNVSINNSLPVPVSIVGGRVSVFVDQVPFNVSINNSLPVPVSIVGGRVSIQGISQVSVAGAVTVSPLTNTGAAVPSGAFMVGGTDGTNLRALLVDALGALKVTGFVTNSEASFTRPTDTVQYAAGDLLANSTVAGTVTPMTFAVSRYTTGGGNIIVRRARIVKSDGDLTAAQFRLHLYNTSQGITNDGVSVATGDNTGYVATKVSNYLGFLSVTCQTSHSTGAVGWGGPNEGMEMNVVLGSAQFGIQGLLEARSTYTPSSAERFNVTIEVYQD